MNTSFLDGKSFFIVSVIKVRKIVTITWHLSELCQSYRACTQELQNSKLTNGMLQVQINELKKRKLMTEQMLETLEFRKRRRDWVILGFQVAIIVFSIVHFYPEIVSVDSLTHIFGTFGLTSGDGKRSPQLYIQPIRRRTKDAFNRKDIVNLELSSPPSLLSSLSSFDSNLIYQRFLFDY